MAKYQRRVVTFFDVLGFKDIISTCSADFIFDVLTKLKAQANHEPEIMNSLNVRAVVFSDSVVRAAGLTDSEGRPIPTGPVWIELFNVAFCQAFMACDGVFLRGAISAGDIFIDSDIVFGPALVRAYTIESEVATFPRIVIDPELIEEIRSNPEIAENQDPASEFKKAQKVISVDNDGFWYIDYLRAMWELEMNLFAIYGTLVKHLDFVLKAANRFEEPSRVASKYKWLIDYHNKSIDYYLNLKAEFSTHHLSDFSVLPFEDLKVNASDVPAHYFT